ncbi:MAG: YkgJ family cysteine cluster protein [Lachnospiraceae bacterium]|nr:YkgJ family cysteine cluster protein [Lachnospiraceae bacterium]
MSATAGYMADILRDMKAGVWDYTEDGKCSQCGSCCSDFLPVGKHELKRIRDYVKKHEIKQRRHCAPFVQKIEIDMVCPFRNSDDKRCEIYPVRPAICRDFRCDKPQKGIWADRAKYESQFSVVSMRETFFREETE